MLTQFLGCGSKSHAFTSIPEDLTPERSRVDKVNAELVTLTYGTIVAQLCKDYESDYVEVNKQLDKMGYNIGLRLIEDYLAKSNSMKRCANFRETAEMIAKVYTTPLYTRSLLTHYRLDSRSSSISHLRSRIGRAIPSNSP